MEQQQINLSQDNIVQAAAAGIQLLNTPGAVNVPSPMAISGISQVLHSLLLAIVNKQVMVLQMPAQEKLEETPPPEGDEKKPDLTPVEGGKQAEK
jgi:hypothetical protein